MSRTQPFGIVFPATLTAERVLAVTLLHYAKRRNAKVTWSEDSTSVNVSMPNGSFICTSCEYSLADNLNCCIDFIRRTRVGGVWPVAKPRFSNFGEIVGKIRRIIEADDYASEMDSMFDGGEFSGPAHARALENEIDECLAKYGMDRAMYNEELSARVQMNYTRHCLYRV